MAELGGSALFARALPRERGPRAAAAAAAARAAHAAVDAAPEVGRPARGRQPLRLVPDHPRDLPRGPARRLRHAGAASTCWPRSASRRIRVVSVESRSASPFASLAPVRLRRLVHVRGRRAARPSAAPRRSRSTASCWPSCSAPRSCASCSTRRRSPTSSSSSRGWPGRAARARSTAWPICCAASATCATDEVAARASTSPRRRRAPAPSWRHPRRAVRVRIARRGALDRGRGRRRAIATRSARARRPAWPRRGSRPRIAPLDAAPARWARTHAPFTAERRRPAGASPGPRSRSACGRSRPRAPCSRARSGRAAPRTSSPIADVLRQLRRRSLARLRREVEPVERGRVRPLPARLAGRRLGGRAALGRLVEVVAQLEGVPIPASVLERDVLRARVAGYTPRLLDELGRGRRGRLDRPRLARAATTAASRSTDATGSSCSPAPGASEDRPSEPIHDAIREHLERRGASFFPQLRAAISEARHRRRAARRAVGPRLVGRDDERHVRGAAGPLAATHALEGARRGRGGWSRSGRRRAAGRWSLVADLVGEERSPTERGHALATSAARAPRRRHAGGRRGRGDRRRVRIGLPGAARHGGVGPSAARLLRRRARGRAVRAARRGRPAAGRPRRRSRRFVSWRPPIRPSRTARRSPGPGRRATSGCRCSARPARTSCSSMGTRCSTSSAADAASSPCRRRRTPERAARAVAALPSLVAPEGPHPGAAPGARRPCPGRGVVTGGRSRAPASGRATAAGSLRRPR